MHTKVEMAIMNSISVIRGYILIFKIFLTMSIPVICIVMAAAIR